MAEFPKGEDYPSSCEVNWLWEYRGGSRGIRQLSQLSNGENSSYQQREGESIRMNEAPRRQMNVIVLLKHYFSCK